MDWKMNEKRKKRGGRLARRIALILTLALAIVLADVFSPTIKKWVYALLPKFDYHSAAVQLTHEMEEAGELIAVRNTDTGIMTGTVDALFFGTVSQVSAPYRYEIGLGIKLSDVKLTPGENELSVTVPQPQVLYDNFQVTGTPENNDFWGYATKERYQRMQDDQHAACREEYVSDPKHMSQAWEATCEQLGTLFRQWTGENLRLKFVHEGE